jgi:hypothetical protein
MEQPAARTPFARAAFNSRETYWMPEIATDNLFRNFAAGWILPNSKLRIANILSKNCAERRLDKNLSLRREDRFLSSKSGVNSPRQGIEQLQNQA